MAARRITPIDGELKEIFGILLEVFLREFGEFGGKRDCDLDDCDSVRSLLGLGTYTSN